MLKLSKFHLYSITILAIIIAIALFWPSSDQPTSNTIAQNQSQPIVIPAPPLPENNTESTTQAPVLGSETVPDESQPRLPIEPEIIPEPIEQPSSTQSSSGQSTPEQTQVTAPPKAIEPKNTRPSADEWQNYRVQKGKTLAQLFRDNNLQANDAFVMAKAEGAEKPLSNIQQGQKLRLKANAKGEVQLLEITAPDGKSYSFARLSDGSYYRTP